MAETTTHCLLQKFWQKLLLEDLEPCRLGYRAKYLIQTAKLVEKEGMDVLEALGQPEVTAEEARQSTLQIQRHRSEGG